MTPPIKNCKWAKYPLGDITQKFGENPKLYMEAMGLKAHNGIDLVRPHGEHMYAVEDGTVCAVKNDAGGYGRHIRLVSKNADKDGHHRDWVYGHMEFIGVKDGQEVKEGQFIGTMGNTGFVVSDSTGNGFWGVNPYAGTHVHFGVRPIKPMKKGWTYKGLPGTWGAVNYENGYKGRVDPLPYFLDPKKKSTKIFKIAGDKQDKQLYRIAEWMRSVGL